MEQLKLDFKKISDLANEAIPSKCEYCNKEYLIVCMTAKTKYCPICGFRKIGSDRT